MRERYETLKLNDLRDIAKKRGIKGATALKKSEIIDLMCELDEKEAAKKTESQEKETASEEKKPLHKKKNIVVTNNKEAFSRGEAVERKEAPKAEKPERVDRPEKTKDAAPTSEGAREEAEELADGDDANGILEVMQDGYGFIRCENYLPGENDVYVAPSLIRKFNLKTGDILKGRCRAKKETDKFAALSRLDSVNGYRPEVAMGRWNFENMTPIFPNSRIKLEQPGSSVAMRIMDLISPIGKGQRGMIVSPPKAGKTTLLKEVAKSILRNDSNIHLIILLIDERPEEVTDIKESIEGPNAEVIYSTFDELPEHHKRVAEMVMERAKRLVEHGKDVAILLDSITRLTRAYNIVVPPSGRTLSGGLDPAALHMPKKFFGAARNMREGGSLTILATALIETGSKMDDVIYEEFKGTGNMEMVLDRKLQEKRIFPAINIPKSSTRREDLLLTPEELAAINSLRKGFNGMKADDAVDQCINLFSKTRNNTEFVRMVEKQVRF
ncbi:transcription termination factor Rho [Butyrivibrio sp. INlla14]|uniref:transcription termination factor Rho n=1 Tax=Butyrivibrio sp. INlla14 TaxID=1520808 RepID=UPI0008766F99|nr:transcription termination factor Rho [Butyrivibrio sp. INlla14]SCX85583.1 transcription termination factor Rho [Butyrivibrio sp. INlla14]